MSIFKKLLGTGREKQTVATDGIGVHHKGGRVTRLPTYLTLAQLLRLVGAT